MAFMDDDFLLDSEPARRLYHEYAADMPIIDYHCHLPPELVANDHRFADLAEIWLGGDHYKWRAMRSNGVAEYFCTGDAAPREKFQKWAETVPYCLRNPLYHWTHLELKRPFGITGKQLSPDTAEDIWQACNEKLADPAFSARGIMKQFDVRVVCTTDDPVDSLAHHCAVAADSTFDLRMLPTWRPDKAMAVGDLSAWNAYCDQLAAVSGISIDRYDDLLAALQKRHDHFHEQGCRLSDHGLETVPEAELSAVAIAAIFDKARCGKALDTNEIAQFQSAMLLEGARMDHAAGWVQQFHIGAIRNNNPRLFAKLGPDTGFDSIGDSNYAKPLAKLLGRLDMDDRLAKTILYNLNPKDNHVLGTMIGNFQDGSSPGKMQFGSGWWFLDQLDGMRSQIETLSQLGLLSRFVGMLTDSRSFLSYTRHEFFRRLLCQILGRDMRDGLIPEDWDLVGGMVQDISYRNAEGYFPF